METGVPLPGALVEETTMKIAKLSVFALAALAFTVGCKDKGGDSGDSGAGGTDGADGGGADGGEGPSVDSCLVADWGICYEYTDYSETEAWCDSLAASYGVTTSYAPVGESACDGLGTCSIPAGGDFSVAAEAFYDESMFDAASAEAACLAGGGTWNG